MRIVAGKHAGRHLTSPAKRIRPTAEGVRDRWLDRLAGQDGANQAAADGAWPATISFFRELLEE